MFGDLSGMMAKIKASQAQIEVTKNRLNTVLIDSSSAQGKVKVTVNANSEVKSITISNDLDDKEAMEDYLVLALNEALTKAAAIRETELAAAAKEGLPDIPGMDMFK